MAIKRTPSVKDIIFSNVHHYRLNHDTFTIFVSGDADAYSHDDDSEPGVTHHMADRFERNLNILSSIDPDRPIAVIMSSNGGFWEEGMQMFGAVLTCSNPITVIATKDARSMTSLIPLAADRFLIRPPAKYMIHTGTGGGSGTSIELDTIDAERRKEDEVMLRIYATRLKETHPRVSETRLKEQIKGLFQSKVDVWYSSDEAVKAGFVDDLFLGQSDWRAEEVNEDRRAKMVEAISRPVKVEISVT